MSFKLMLFCLLFTLNSWAQESSKALSGFDPVADVISDGLETGSWLIYDCENKHWTCVLESYYQACEEKRNEDIEARKTQLRCAPIGEFPTKKSCFQRQLYLVGQNYSTRFCMGEELREREIRF